MHLIVPNLGYHPDHLGGACRYTTELCERLARRGHRIEAIYPATPEHPPGTEVRHCVVLHRHGNADGFFLGNWHAENRQARALIEQIFARAQKPPLLLLSHAYYWPAVAPYRQRTAFFIHGPWGREFRFSRQTRVRGWLKRCFDEVIARRLDAIERTALRRVRQVQTTSRYMMAQLPIWHGNFNTPVIGVGGGVNLVQFKPDPARQAYRREMGVGENDFVFLTVRRLDPRMGLLPLLEAFAMATKDLPQARLWLTGRGSQEAALRRRIEELGLARRVQLLGFVPDEVLPRVISAADCTVMPSLDLEGFGLATVESLACGTPVLGSRRCATPEILEPLNPELLFEAEQPEVLTALLRRTVTQPGWLPNQAACRKYAEDRFDWEKVTTGVENALAQLGGAA